MFELMENGTSSDYQVLVQKIVFFILSFDISFYVDLGLQYMSKLDEFEGFVERVRKYGLTSPTLMGSQASTILVVDDLPVVNRRDAYGRLERCLTLLVQLVRIPTAIVITNYDKNDSADYSTHCWEELLVSLHSAGACKVAFLDRFALDLNSFHLFILNEMSNIPL